jgi:hypothetical protein
MKFLVIAVMALSFNANSLFAGCEDFTIDKVTLGTTLKKATDQQISYVISSDKLNKKDKTGVSLDAVKLSSDYVALNKTDWNDTKSKWLQAYMSDCADYLNSQVVENVLSCTKKTNCSVDYVNVAPYSGVKSSNVNVKVGQDKKGSRSIACYIDKSAAKLDMTKVLVQGTKVTLLDTGFNFTIPAVIAYTNASYDGKTPGYWTISGFDKNGKTSSITLSGSEYITTGQSDYMFAPDDFCSRSYSGGTGEGAFNSCKAKIDLGQFKKSNKVYNSLVVTNSGQLNPNTMSGQTVKKLFADYNNTIIDPTTDKDKVNLVADGTKETDVKNSTGVCTKPVKNKI